MESPPCYPIRCILPYDRYVSPSKSRIAPIENEETIQNLQDYATTSTIKFYRDNAIDASSEIITYQALAEKFQFQYVPHLVFLHEKDLREVFLNKPDQEEGGDAFVLNSESFSSLQLKQWLHTAYINPSISVRHVGVIDAVDVGFGVFAEDDMFAGSFIGEYVGIVHSTSGSSQFVKSMQQEVDDGFSDRLAYTCQYPSCDGGLGINAIEYGNVIRFINHSSNPNAELRYYWGEGGLMHVLCVSSQAMPAISSVLIFLSIVYPRLLQYY